MRISRIEDMVGGWFVGNFTPAMHRTKDCEVGYKFHPKGDIWAKHYHKIATEITFLIKGSMVIQGKTLTSGDIFIILPNEIADPIFLEDCEVVIVKVPSVIGDKYEVTD